MKPCFICFFFLRVNFCVDSPMPNHDCTHTAGLCCQDSNVCIPLTFEASYFHETCRKCVEMCLPAPCRIWAEVANRFTRGWQIGNMKAYKCSSCKPYSWGNWTKSKGMHTLDFVSSDFDNMLKEWLIRNHKCRLKRNKK